LPIYSFGRDEDGEPDYDPDELEEEAPEPPAPEEPDVDQANEDQQEVTGGRQVVNGDASAGSQKPTNDSAKKIPDEKRSTTPYMTKYERARVLGTRALQIRFNLRAL
jgi:DNA-directed RNA polymerase I, II, and III subunit RPABC2